MSKCPDSRRPRSKRTRGGAGAFFTLSADERSNPNVPRMIERPASSDGSSLLHGKNASLVIDAVKSRLANPAVPDGKRLGLVIEGGAMRGVCSAGGLVALEHLGLSDVFDEIYATSAGAMNSSYFLSAQASFGIRIYYEDMAKGRVINPWRLWKVLDLDRIFDHIVGRERALRVDAVQSSRTHLFAAVLDADTGESWLVDTRATRTPLLTVLKACTAVPVVYNGSVVVDGRRCIDAGVACPFPMREALASSCTDLLVMLTRPAGFRWELPGRMSDWLFRAYARGNRRLLRAYAEQPERDAELRDLALGRTPARAGVNIATLCTADDEVVHRLTVDPAQLHAAALGFGRRTLQVLGADVQAWSLPSPA